MEMIAMLHKDVTKVYLFISILFLNHNRLVSQGCCRIISKSCLTLRVRLNSFIFLLYILYILFVVQSRQHLEILLRT